MRKKEGKKGEILGTISSTMKIIFNIICICTSFALKGDFYIKSIYSRLDPSSISQALAFYELYPESSEGERALRRVATQLGEIQDPHSLMEAVNRFSHEPLSEEQVAFIEELASYLPNRKLKGYQAASEKEVLSLPPDEIDVGRALLLSQLEGEPEMQKMVRSYSALLDLMALQVLTQVTLESSPEEKIRALNRFIFEESRFRFPPHSLYAKEIDLYTFLPSVMDNHLGVCLGVTALYLALSQRVDLPLEIVTPPGHIYLRYRTKEKTIVIETTARGVDVSEDHYLSVNLVFLKLRTKKEVIGMTHVNQASTYLHQENFPKAIKAYQKAKPYLEDDLLVKELLGFSLLFNGQKQEAMPFIQEASEKASEEVIVGEKMAEDFIRGEVDEEGLKAVFMLVDEKRESILQKQKRLKETVEKYPHFRAGLEQLAVSYLQLNRAKEGLAYLLKYHEIDSTNPVIEYYLSLLHGEREDYASCWKFLKKAEALTSAKNCFPKPLKELRRELLFHCPEPKDPDSATVSSPS